jgi:hypothetical protein
MASAKDDNLDIDILKSKSVTLSAELESKVKSPNAGKLFYY